MKRYLGISFALLCGLLLIANVVIAKPAGTHSFTSIEDENDLGNADGTTPVAGKVLQDTIWIADWSFDPGCTSTGWVKFDERINNDGSNYWSVNTSYAGAGTGTIDNSAAVLTKHDLCWAYDGYGNNWDYSIVLKYSGATAELSFDFIAQTEAGFDFVTVEGDSLGLSEALVDYSVDPEGTPAANRGDALFTNDGDLTAGVSVTALALPDFGPGTHEAYIRFSADGAVSPEDGEEAFTLLAAVVVDNIVVTGGIAYSEDFEGALNSNVTLVNSASATPFGEWARLYSHITDNDKCTENTTCAWLWTDPVKIALFADMAFGPGSAIIRNWLDDTIVSPWASLASTPLAQGTVLSFRRFPGNRFNQGAIVQNWRVRGKVRIENTDTSAGGDSIDCVSPWGHVSMWNSLTVFNWVTSIFDATAFFAGNSTEIQFAFRVSDWRWIAGANPIVTLNPGPGPYLDRVRIGRRVISGPVFDIGLDTRFQANDNFPSAQNAITPGEHFSATTDRFGTCDFRQGTELGINGTSSNVISGDSVTTNILDSRLAGGITSVRWYGAITSGPHAGKAPAPYTVGANGFFEVTPDSARSAASGAVVANRWFVDLDDTYLRGGDELKYYWFATDAGAGSTSAPGGISSAPASVAAAEAATNGLFTMSALPTIDWDPAYLARIAADANGDLDPTVGELANSSQKNCILYYQHTTSNRRSGPVNTTSFMRTLNALGYNGDYDVYDPQGYGNTNNQLASRATIEQCQGYELIVEDDGRSGLVPNIPDGIDNDSNKIRQATFYRNWLDQGDLAGRATLWIIGESSVAEFPTNTLFTTYCGVGAVVQDQALSVNPDVVGQTSYSFSPSSCVASFSGDVFSLNGGCPVLRNYDGYTAGGTAVSTHRYRAGVTLGTTAILMNSRPADNANTILMGFGWFDIRRPFCVPPGCPSPSPSNQPAKILASKILGCVLTAGCQEPLDASDTGDDGDQVDALPRVSALYQNVPNPFNPTTKIHFDLSRSGQVKLQVFDVAGHVVRTLVNNRLEAKRGHEVTWNGLDDAGKRVSSGVYFYQLVTDELTATKKMVVMK
jgi:hypothetical protein